MHSVLLGIRILNYFKIKTYTYTYINVREKQRGNQEWKIQRSQVHAMSLPSLQSTGGEDVPKIFLCRNRNGHHNTKLQLLTCSWLIGPNSIYRETNGTFFGELRKNIKHWITSTSILPNFWITSDNILVWNDLSVISPVADAIWNDKNGVCKEIFIKMLNVKNCSVLLKSSSGINIPN